MIVIDFSPYDDQFYIMQTLRFNFQAPVSGEARFYPAQGQHQACQHKSFENDGEHALQLDVGHLPKGSWRLEMEWISDGRSYTLTREFSVPGVSE